MTEYPIPPDDESDATTDAVDYLSDAEAEAIAAEPDEYEDGRDPGPHNPGVH